MNTLRPVLIEHRAGFEPAVLRICNPVRWAAPPPMLNKYYMDQERCLELIERLLKARSHDYYGHEQLAYERGFLTGLLVQLMQQDPRIQLMIRHMIDER
jgi:hypothetical protein